MQRERAAGLAQKHEGLEHSSPEVVEASETQSAPLVEEEREEAVTAHSGPGEISAPSGALPRLTAESP